jgi:hypothetical protein
MPDNIERIEAYVAGMDRDTFRPMGGRATRSSGASNGFARQHSAWETRQPS